MARLNIDRRQLLKIGISSGVLAAMPFKNIVLADAVNDKLLEYVSDSDRPVDEQRTGRLSQTDFDILSALCVYVNQTWELTPDLKPYLLKLKEDLAYKTRETPSYLTEYEHAIELINQSVSDSESLEQTWLSLLFAQFSAENFPHTRLGRARNFVFSEIIAHQVPLSGGFKSFGLRNYRGYAGGPFTSPSSYRRGDI